MTRNHDYETPTAGALDWHLPLNENFEKIDTDIEVRDKESNRSNYEPKERAKFLAMDTGAVYIGNGTEWIRMPVDAAQLSVGNTVTTSVGDTVADVNSRLATLGDDEALDVRHPLTVGESEEITIPSDSVLLISAPITRADGAAGSNYSILRNTDFSAGNQNISLHFRGGHIDGNRQNQPEGESSRFGLQFVNVDGLEIRNPTIRNPYNWAVRIEDSTNVRGGGFWTNTNKGETNHSDGLHFVDTSNVEWHGVSGTSEDDLLAITVDNKRSVSNLVVTGVTGRSINANIVRLNKAISTLNDGVEREIRDVSITGISGESAGANGIAIRNGDPDTYFRNITLSGIIRNPTWAGVTGRGHFSDCDIAVSVEGAGRSCYSFLDAESIDSGCRFSGSLRDPSQSSSSAVFANVSGATFDFSSTRSAADSAVAHVKIISGDGATVRGTYVGGENGVWLGTGSSQVRRTGVIGAMFEEISSRGVYDNNASSTLVTGCRFHGVSTPLSMSEDRGSREGTNVLS